MNVKHQASAGGKLSLPSGLATTQLRPCQVGTSAAVEVLLRLLGCKTVLDACTWYYLVCGRY